MRLPRPPTSSGTAVESTSDTSAPDVISVRLSMSALTACISSDSEISAPGTHDAARSAALAAMTSV